MLTSILACSCLLAPTEPQLPSPAALEIRVHWMFLGFYAKTLINLEREILEFRDVQKKFPMQAERFQRLIDQDIVLRQKVLSPPNKKESDWV